MELQNLAIASEAYLPEGWMGQVRLAPPPLADFARVTAGQCRYHVDPDWSKPVGMLTAISHDESSGMYRADVTVPEIDATPTKDYLAQREAGLRGDVSVGYNIERLILVEIGKTWDDDKFDAAWELLEASDVTVPADVSVGEGRSRQFAKRRLPSGLLLMRGANFGTIPQPVLAQAMAERAKQRALLNKIRS